MMAFGIKFCLSKSSKSSKQRSASQHQSNRKNSNNIDAFQTTNDNFRENNNLHTNTNGLNGNSNSRDSQHSLNIRDHHTTPTTTTTTPNANNSSGPNADLLEQNNQNLNPAATGIRHVTAEYYAVVEDELNVVPGDICLFEYAVEDELGKSWSSVLCLTRNGARGFVPSEILSIEKPKYLALYRKKIPKNFVSHGNGKHHHHHHHSRHDHHASLNPHHHSHNHRNHHLDENRTSHHQGVHHTICLIPNGMSSTGEAGHMSRVSQCEVNKMSQCISEKTCPSNGDSIRFQALSHAEPHNHLVGPALSSDHNHHSHHQSRLDIHHHGNMLHGSSSGCQTFQKYPEPFPVHHLALASYYNLDDAPPPAEMPYAGFRPLSECIPFRREESGDLYVVLFNFVNREERDISVKPGDFVHVLNKDDINWYWVRRVEDDLEGFVPSRFIVPNEKAESILNKGNSTVTMKSSNPIDCHTYINSNQVPERESLKIDQQSLPCQQM